MSSFFPDLSSLFPVTQPLRDTAPAVKAPDWREITDRWITNNPDVYNMFRRFAVEMYDLGRKFSINLLRERVRWECLKGDGTAVKFSNNMAPYIGRRLVGDDGRLHGYLTFRPVRH